MWFFCRKKSKQWPNTVLSDFEDKKAEEKTKKVVDAIKKLVKIGYIFPISRINLQVVVQIVQSTENFLAELIQVFFFFYSASFTN